MKKTIEPQERKNLSSGKFTKLFIKHFILNGIIVGIVITVINEIGNKFLPTAIATLLSLVLVFVGIVKIYLSAIKDSFYEGKIYQADINKIAKNIVLIFVVIMLITVVGDYMSYARSIKLAQVLGMDDIVTRNLIINTVVNVIMYTIIALSCRVKFLKECENQDNII